MIHYGSAYVQQMLNWEQFWNLRMGAPLSGGRGIVAASSGLNVGGPPMKGSLGQLSYQLPLLTPSLYGLCTVYFHIYLSTVVL